MNSVIQQLYERKSIRAFEDKEIPEEIIQEILHAATMAPTAGNQQLYTILRITDPMILAQLVESCDHQPFIAKGKLILLFLADCLKWFDAFRYENCNPRLPGEGDLLLAINDALIAAQNCVVAAWSYGIGSCYIGDIMENIEIHRELLDLPDYVFPAALLVFGYPTEQQKKRPKPARADLRYIVQENRYQKLSRQDLQKMLQEKAGSQTYQEWLQAFCNRKYNSDFSKEMTRSVREYLKQYHPQSS